MILQPIPLEAGDVHQKFRTIAGREILFDKQGFLWHPEDWSEEVAVALALESGIEALSNDYGVSFVFSGLFCHYHGRAPLNRDLKAGLGMSLMDLECLFPGGIRHGARRIAGLPNPRACTG